jgi:hypothetical protein
VQCAGPIRYRNISLQRSLGTFGETESINIRFLRDSELAGKNLAQTKNKNQSLGYARRPIFGSAGTLTFLAFRFEVVRQFKL